MAHETFTPPYVRSWVDRFFDWIEGLRLPTWLFYAGLFAIAIILGFWFEPPNTPHTPGWLFTAGAPGAVAATHWLRSVSKRSFEQIRPALNTSGAATADLQYRLVVTPAKAAWLLLAFEVAYQPLYVMSGAEPFGVRELAPWILIPGVVNWLLGETFALVLGYMTVRRLILIATVRKRLTRIKLFRQQPLHAFSAVTFRSALVLLYFSVYIPLLSIGTEAFNDEALWTLVSGTVLAAVVAILPLIGTHNAIAAERRTRSMANGERIEHALDMIDKAVDDRDSDEIDSHQKALGVLLTKRDLIAGAPTWPWARGTIRTLATTILLPILLLVASRVADRLLG